MATMTYDEAAAELRKEHAAEVHGYGFSFYWACSCGKSGPVTTNGRASNGKSRHLSAEYRKQLARRCS